MPSTPKHQKISRQEPPTETKAKEYFCLTRSPKNSQPIEKSSFKRKLPHHQHQVGILKDNTLPCAVVRGNKRSEKTTEVDEEYEFSPPNASQTAEILLEIFQTSTSPLVRDLEAAEWEELMKLYNEETTIIKQQKLPLELWIKNNKKDSLRACVISGCTKGGTSKGERDAGVIIKSGSILDCRREMERCNFYVWMQKGRDCHSPSLQQQNFSSNHQNSTAGLVGAYCIRYYVGAATNKASTGPREGGGAFRRNYTQRLTPSLFLSKDVFARDHLAPSDPKDWLLVGLMLHGSERDVYEAMIEIGTRPISQRCVVFNTTPTDTSSSGSNLVPHDNDGEGENKKKVIDSSCRRGTPERASLVVILESVGQNQTNDVVCAYPSNEDCDFDFFVIMPRNEDEDEGNKSNIERRRNQELLQNTLWCVIKDVLLS